MITVISGTNRPDSNSSHVARQYVQCFEEQGREALYFSLESLPESFYCLSSYGAPNKSFEQVFHDYIEPSSHFVFVVPEYNGSFPGVLKHFLDLGRPEVWKGKKAALAGVASGRAGNLRGMDHLTAVLHYLKVVVYHSPVVLSSIHMHLDPEANTLKPEYRSSIEQQSREFTAF